MSDATAKIAARLAELWQSSRPAMQERMAVLHRAHETLRENLSDGDARSAGREAAHKLSGVLGVFGLPRGSEIASEIEHILKPEHPLAPADLATLASAIAELDAVIASRDSSLPS